MQQKLPDQPPQLPPRDDTTLPPGSVVQLRSGGPYMTVHDMHPHIRADKSVTTGYHCSFFDKDGRVQRLHFLRWELIQLPHREAMADSEAMDSKRLAARIAPKAGLDQAA